MSNFRHMMTSPNKKNRLARFLPVSALCAALFFAYPSSQAEASLSTELQTMFSNVTAPGSVDSALSMGWAGGGVGVRSPIRNLQLVSLDPPRLSAGCGGIDLYGGSFSFINSEQFIALLRAVAMNAVGVAFKAAVDAINPQLGNIMGSFQEIIQNLNSTMANTCALASTIVDSTKSYLSSMEVTKSTVSGEATASGTVSDSISNYLGGVANTIARWGNKSNEVTQKAAGDPKYPEIGNLVWKALGKSGSANHIGNPITGETTEKASKEFIMSMLGTIVVGAGAANENSRPTTDAGEQAPPILSPHAATLDVLLVRDGPQEKQSDEVYLLRCSETTNAAGGTVPDGACNIVTRTEVTTSFSGIQGYINEMFFGSKEGKQIGIAAESILGKIKYCSGTNANACGFTAQQEALLYSIDGPVLALLTKVQHNDVAMAHVADYISPLVANQLAISYADAILDTAKHAFDGRGQQEPPQFIKDKVLEIREFRDMVVQESRKIWDDYAKAQAFVENVVKSEGVGLN